MLLAVKKKHVFTDHRVTSICLALHMLGDRDEVVRTTARPLLCHFAEIVINVPFEDTCHIGFNSGVHGTQLECVGPIFAPLSDISLVMSG